MFSRFMHFDDSLLYERAVVGVVDWISARVAHAAVAEPAPTADESCAVQEQLMWVDALRPWSFLCLEVSNDVP